MVIWMKVSKDKYELPEIIADSASELAKKCNVTRNVIYSCINRQGRSQYKKVRIEE